ncbi:hypothetical protein C8Q73DRAFT_787046 [Cubamyces lactineus]|nr:hypothetical protein C8Q73DRAFT_787046 [Cubamyces lactineus]
MARPPARGMQRPYPDSELEYIDINEGIGEINDDDELYDDEYDYEARDLMPRRPASTSVRSARSAAPQPSTAGSASTARLEQEEEVHKLQVEGQRKDNKIKELEIKLAQHEANRIKRQMRSAKEGALTHVPVQAPTQAPTQTLAQAANASVQVQRAPTQATNQPDPTTSTEMAPAINLTDNTHPLAHYRSAIDNLGRKFSIFHMPFTPPPETFGFSERPDVDPLDYNTRYPYRCTAAEQFATLVQSYAAGIYDMVPASLWVHIPNPYFAAVFNHGIKDSRYKVLSNARGARAAIFAGLPDFNHAVFGEKPVHLLGPCRPGVQLRWSGLGRSSGSEYDRRSD